MRWDYISDFLFEYFPDDYIELRTPKEDSDGFQLVGENGKALTSYYKWDKWKSGQSISKEMESILGMPKKQKSIWNLSLHERYAKMKMCKI